MMAHARSVLWWFLRVAASGGILIYVVSIVPILQVSETIKGARTEFLLGGWALFVIGYYVGAWSLRILTHRQGLSISAVAIFKVNLATQFYQLFLPGGFIAGGIVRWYKLSRHDNKPAQALAAILFNRMLEVCSLSLLALGFWAFDGVAVRQPLYGAVLVVITAVLCVLYLVSVNRRVWRTFDGIINTIPFLPRIVTKRILNLSRSLAHFNTFGVSDHLVILTLSLLRNLIRIASLICFSYAINLDVAHITLSWVRSLTALISMVPISYLGLGVREGSLLILLKPYGVTEIEIISLAMLWFSGLLVAAFCGGLIEARMFIARRQGPL